ncbi:MAG: MFS transporter [Candidatus Pacebacteria bacterium]|nr:MFS transporter [Candidatus Paceibacterota bacterium]
MEKIKNKKWSFVTKTILILGLVSFFTDIASEMLYPIMPMYLSSIGYGVVAIGLVEGISELFAGLTKLYSGILSDRTGHRAIFIKIGYSISALVKPAIGFTSSIGLIIGAKFLDRFGKGIRTSARDALITSESSPEVRGQAFGFHRSLDTFGALLGPIIGLIILVIYPTNYSLVFALALIPGIIAIFCTFLLKKEPNQKNQNSQQKIITRFKEFWKQSSPSYKKILFGLVLFALINSTNMFLILRATELGFKDNIVLFSYIVFNLIFAISSFPIGKLADKIGFKKIYIIGLMIFTLVYSLLGGPINSPIILLSIFAFYGIFSAIDEGASKAWISTHIQQEHRATGLGLYFALSSLAFFFSSIATSFIWKHYGGPVTFTIVGLISIIPILYFLMIKTPNEKPE